MAYQRRSYARSRTRSRSSYGGRRRTSRRRRRVSRTPQKVVIQVIGGPGGYVPISSTMGTKGRRILRARH